MLIYDLNIIGERLYFARKRRNLTQAEVAESAEISDRTYADIERGSVNMRISTFLQICRALHITPDEVLSTDSHDKDHYEDDLISQLNSCTPSERNTALSILKVYLNSLKQ